MVRMIPMIGRRLALSFVILSLTALIVFLGTEVLPGDALTATIPAEELAFYSPQQIAEMRHEYGLDRPVYLRFLEVWQRLFTLDFGTTIVKREPVFDRILHPMINSAILAGVALAVTLAAVIVLGVLASLRPGGRLDNAISGTTLFTYSMPDFVVSIPGASSPTPEANTASCLAWASNLPRRPRFERLTIWREVETIRQRDRRQQVDFVGTEQARPISIADVLMRVSDLNIDRPLVDPPHSHPVLVAMPEAVEDLPSRGMNPEFFHGPHQALRGSRAWSDRA